MISLIHSFSTLIILCLSLSLLVVVYQSLERETREETRVFTREQRADCIIKNRTESSTGIFRNLLPLFLHEFLLLPHDVQETKRACPAFGSCVTTIHSVRLEIFLLLLFRKTFRHSKFNPAEGSNEISKNNIFVEIFILVQSFDQN